MSYADYDPLTGRILQVSSHPVEGAPQIEVPANFDDAAHYVEAGAIVPFPAPPSANHTWDWSLKAWVDARALVDVKQAQARMLRVAAMAAANANLTVQTVTFAVSQEIRAELAQELALAQAEGASYSLEWERADGTPITLTGAQVKGLLRAMSTRAQNIRATLRTKLSGVQAATTTAAVEAITWG